MEAITRRRLLRLLVLVAISVAAVTAFPGRVAADVPVVRQIENLTKPPDSDDVSLFPARGKVKLQIAHDNPTGAHYVDVIQVEWRGVVENYPQQPQNSNPFTVTIDLGEFPSSQTPSVKARAHCTQHGWSAWSEQIEIPEFPLPAVTILIALAASLASITHDGRH